jgi:hypothetical protein
MPAQFRREPTPKRGLTAMQSLRSVVRPEQRHHPASIRIRQYLFAIIAKMVVG